MARGALVFKERDVRRLIRAFTKEGVPVQGGRVDRDGNIEVFTGEPEDSPSGPMTGNEERGWDKAIHAAHEKRTA
jgi:hypothetical protein